MTDFESKGSHERIGARGFEALDSKSTWSSFDDISWEIFGGDDHSVPDPDQPAPPPWLRGGGKKDPNSKAAAEGESSKLMDTAGSASTMDVDNWDSLNVAELAAVPDSLENMNPLGMVMKQEESADDLLAGCLEQPAYNEEDGSIVTSSFAFSDVPTEEEMALFGAGRGESDVEKVLEYHNWDSLEDMDNLFQNEEATFGTQDATDALLQWPSTSSSPESGNAATKSPELRAMKGKLHDQDVKMEFIPCDSFDNKAVEVCASNLEIDKDKQSLDVQPGPHELERSQSSGKMLADMMADAVDQLTSPKEREQKSYPSDVDKPHQLKRQGSTNRKRGDDRFKKQIFSKKNANYSKQSIQQQQPVTTPYTSTTTQPLQLKPAVASSLQVYPQVIGPSPGAMLTMQQRPPYLHHHNPYLQPSSQPIMMCYSEEQQYEEQQDSSTRPKLEIPPPPASGTNMTPEEKIEKLRWKQKMQRLASEQCISPIEASRKQVGTSLLQTGESSTVATVKSEEHGDERIVEAAVLNQLLSIMSKLDVGTRISIRDALYRLSRSAISRHGSDGPSSSEGSNSSASERHITRTLRYPMLETETNPIDRTIANLLFHRRSTGSMVTLPHSTSEIQGGPSSSWTWQQPPLGAQVAEVSEEASQEDLAPAANPSQHSSDGECVGGKNIHGS